ncbi:hypothetical protein [Pedobacter sp. R-06]|uniref:hypothetical protein n=1 Tax=Pedobacter sp. R-06 TaxID=3404051 RepID=UPI003CE81E5E
MGTIVKQDKSQKPVETLFWRIHKIDIKKQEIELTEFDRHFYNSEKIVDPQKNVRKGGIHNGYLWIEFEYGLGKVVRVHLQLVARSDLIYLKDKDSQINLPYSFSLAKISNDTSYYVKPKGEVKIGIIKRTGI